MSAEGPESLVSHVPTGVFSPSEWSALAAELALSPRETEVAHSLFQGLSDRRIAEQVQISIPTVRTHLTRLFTRLNVQDRNELILHIFRHFRAGCRGPDCPRQQRFSARQIT